MGVNSLPKTVTRQRRACDFWTRALLRMVRFLVYDTGLVQYRWTGLDLLTADGLKMQDWKIVNSSKYSLSCCTYVFHRCRFVLHKDGKLFPYLHFPPLYIRTYVFRTCIFHLPVLSFSVLAFSVAPAVYLVYTLRWRRLLYTGTMTGPFHGTVTDISTKLPGNRRLYKFLRIITSDTSCHLEITLVSVSPEIF